MNLFIFLVKNSLLSFNEKRKKRKNLLSQKTSCHKVFVTHVLRCTNLLQNNKNMNNLFSPPCWIQSTYTNKRLAKNQYFLPSLSTPKGVFLSHPSLFQSTEQSVTPLSWCISHIGQSQSPSGTTSSGGLRQ